MVKLFGQELARRELAARTGAPATLAGVRLVTLGDDQGRGVRMLEFRTGSGLDFVVAVDRALDVVEVGYAGAQLGWNSPTGIRDPGLHEEDGENGLGWLRSFNGFLVTCGLDHTFFTHEEDSPHFHFPARARQKHSIHGRIGNLPARLTGYGETWDGEVCTLWCEGVVRQAAAYGENLELHRRIEAVAGQKGFVIKDRVVNAGFYDTPHMLLYHINLGWPLLDEGARYVAPILDSPFAGHADRYRKQNVGYRTCAAPANPFVEQVWEHRCGADADGLTPVALINDGFDGGKGLGFVIETRKSELPVQIEWQNFQAGMYAIGLEPGTHHVKGRAFADERGETIILGPGEERSYEVRCSVLDGKAEIAELEARINRIAPPVLDEYPALSGNWEKLPARR